jgi:hypothetical protein
MYSRVLARALAPLELVCPHSELIEREVRIVSSRCDLAHGVGRDATFV